MNEEAFLSALHESPNDEVTWLALADWLDEDGQPQRAELIRLVRQLRTLPFQRRAGPRATLENRVAALLKAGVRPVVPEVVNNLGMRFALIPPGRFRMGSTRGERGRTADEKAHEVTLTQPFYLGVFLVTQAQYQSVMGSNPSNFSRLGKSPATVKDIPDEELADFPVDTVSWEDAQALAQSLTLLEAGMKAYRSYRLPTEAEWEYACRGGTASTSAFHVGRALGVGDANCIGTGSHEESISRLRRTCKVGSYPPNVFGLYDMHGNLWEWCQDWYGDYENGPVTDPSGPPTGSARILRGGCWANAPYLLRSASRFKYSPSSRYDSRGIRLVLQTTSGGSDERGRLPGRAARQPRRRGDVAGAG